MMGIRVFITLVSPDVRDLLTPRADLMLGNLALRRQRAVLAAKPIRRQYLPHPKRVQTGAPPTRSMSSS
jgi:hypothetical protein